MAAAALEGDDPQSSEDEAEWQRGFALGQAALERAQSVSPCSPQSPRAQLHAREAATTQLEARAAQALARAEVALAMRPPADTDAREALQAQLTAARAAANAQQHARWQRIPPTFEARIERYQPQRLRLTLLSELAILEQDDAVLVQVLDTCRLVLTSVHPGRRDPDLFE